MTDVQRLMAEIDADLEIAEAAIRADRLIHKAPFVYIPYNLVGARVIQVPRTVFRDFLREIDQGLMTMN